VRPVFAALIVLATLGLAACGSDENSEPEGYLENCTPAEDEAAGPNTSDPRSDELAQEAVDILNEDAGVRELIGSREFTTPRQIPWSAGDAGDATGFVVTMRFAEPFSIDSEEWPLVVYPGAGRPNNESVPRLLCLVGLKAKEVSAIEATVNLQSRKIEDLYPTGPRGPVGGGQPEVEYEDFGPLPEKYQPVPGY
jgi:hypothetical protein